MCVCVCVCGVALLRHCIDCSLVTCWHVMLQGKHAHALRQLREVRKYAPRCNEAIVLNIECLLAMGRVDEAYGETQDILAENTHNSKFLHMRARCLYLQVYSPYLLASLLSSLTHSRHPPPHPGQLSQRHQALTGSAAQRP